MTPAYDPQWLDVQYNNRARIPEHAEIFARWASDSAQARARLSPVLDFAYGPGAAQTLDVFPARQPGAPVLVFIHGGWWRSLDKSDHSFIAPAFVDAGACVVVPNYDLCPRVTIEIIVMQMVRALAWTWQHAADHGGDPNRIIVAGHSAGGHLAAMMVSCRWRQVDAGLPEDLVKGALSISGVFDLDPVRHTPFLKSDLLLTPQSVARLSPAYFPAPSAPLLATVGEQESEEFLRQNQLIRDRWGPKAVPVCEAIPHTHHLSVVETLAQPGQRVHQLARGLLGLD